MVEKLNLNKLIHAQDIPYEEDCLRHSLTIKSWIRYFEYKSESENTTHDQKVFILARAVNVLPRSYKLWKMLLDLRVNRLLVGKQDEYFMRNVNPEFPPNHREWQSINAHFEQSLVLCNKFPKIWYLYCQFLMHQPSRITFTRRTFDRALKALPVTQHKSLWDLYLAFANRAGGDTTIRIWRRFLKIQPTHAERYCNTLLELDPPRTAEAARVLTAIIETPEKYSNQNGKTMYQYWDLLCQLIMDHPEGIDMPQQDHLVPTGELSSLRPDHLDVELILKTGTKKFTDHVGMLWNSLARWWILQGKFERARDVFEEGIRTVNTVKDFTMIFDAYAKMEETVLSDAMTKVGQEGEFDETDVDLRLARFERLLTRRPFLVSDVILRQNPHNVQEWKNRVQLYLEEGNIDKVIETYTTASKTINPHRCQDNATEIWFEFAKFHEDRDEIDEARNVFEEAVKCNFKKVDDLAAVWCQWAEMEIRLGGFKEAVQVLGRATAPLNSNLNIRYNDDTKSVQQRLFKSIKLWSFYADLEESLGTVESTKAVYSRIMELKIATPQVIINFAAFLEENKYFEESFRAYERGIELFGYPVAFEIWNLYLSKFIQRYQGTKLERARDLFEQALENCPPKYCKDIYLLYAKVEEDYGLARHALKIYDRATKAVEKKDLYEMFTIYIAKAASFFGIISTRDIYTKALEVLPDKSARNMAIKFCEMETKLGEVDRARAILAYASQLCDPRIDPQYWQIWHEFETKYGNEDTFKEMLRVKRSVQAKFNTDVAFISSQILASRGIEPGTEIAQDENNNTAVPGFIRAVESEPKVDATKSANPDEIEVEESSESESSDEEKDIVESTVPKAVFGSLAAQVPEEKLGAKDRFKRKRG